MSLNCKNFANGWRCLQLGVFMVYKGVLFSCLHHCKRVFVIVKYSDFNTIFYHLNRGEMKAVQARIRKRPAKHRDSTWAFINKF